MKEFNVINLNEFSWPLNVAIMGGAFAVFSLIYNDYYIYYGLFTFAFGVLNHTWIKLSDWMFIKDDKVSKYNWITHLVSISLTTGWIISLIYIHLFF